MQELGDLVGVDRHFRVEGLPGGDGLEEDRDRLLLEGETPEGQVVKGHTQ